MKRVPIAAGIVFAAALGGGGCSESDSPESQGSTHSPIPAVSTGCGRLSLAALKLEAPTRDGLVPAVNIGECVRFEDTLRDMGSIATNEPFDIVCVTGKPLVLHVVRIDKSIGEVPLDAAASDARRAGTFPERLKDCPDFSLDPALHPFA
jgi:hypothetical protein